VLCDVLSGYLLLYQNTVRFHLMMALLCCSPPPPTSNIQSSQHCTVNTGDIYNLTAPTITTENKPNALHFTVIFLNAASCTDLTVREVGRDTSVHHTKTHTCSNPERQPLAVHKDLGLIVLCGCVLVGG